MVGQKLGYKTFVLIGGLGGDRFDHSMANLDVLLYISKRGGSAVLCTEDTKSVRCALWAHCADGAERRHGLRVPV